LIIAVAGSSDQAFDQCEESGLLYEFTKEMQSDDLLLKMNAIELLNEVKSMWDWV
jgi:hypothetical protein